MDGDITAGSAGEDRFGQICMCKKWIRSKKTESIALIITRADKDKTQKRERKHQCKID